MELFQAPNMTEFIYTALYTSIWPWKHTHVNYCYPHAQMRKLRWRKQQFAQSQKPGTEEGRFLTQTIWLKILYIQRLTFKNYCFAILRASRVKGINFDAILYLKFPSKPITLLYYYTIPWKFQSSVSDQTLKSTFIS